MLPFNPTIFIIEDESHAEVQKGEYPTFQAAIAELKRRVSIPWDQSPNRCPCLSWQTCSRNYEIVEYDTAGKPWKEVSRQPVLHISTQGAKWLLEHL